MKKTFFVLSLFIAGTGVMSAENVTTPEISPEVSNSEVAEVNGVDEINLHDAYKVTGDRVIFRSGPGKQYAQVKDYEGRAIYYNKGDILLPCDDRKCINGYRHLTLADGDGYEGWISVKYLRYFKYNCGRDCCVK